MKTIITATERETIYNNMTDLLTQYNYNYTADAIYEIIDTWAEQKADLIALFKKHPNYVEGQFLIAFNQDWNRDIDEMGAINFCNWVFNNKEAIYNGLPDELKLKTSRWNSRNTWCYSRIYMPYEAHSVFTNSDFLAHQFVGDGFSRYLNDIDPSLKFKEGMKMSRAINKLCVYLGIDKLPDYNKEFAKFADSVNPLKIVRHTCLSINPIDYLTMSFGNSWASCHTIDKENTRDMPNSYRGQYSSGTISYMLDKVSMVFYTVDAAYNGERYYFQDKINRCMFHYGKDKLIQGRVYPQSNDNNDDGIYKDIREIVQHVMADCLEMPNYWSTKRGTNGIYACVETRGTHYADYINFNNCCISFPKEKEINNDLIVIGHNPICVECGCEHVESESINHCSLHPQRECSNCGRVEDEEDGHWIDDEWYCNDCTTYCDHCNCYCLESEARWVESVGRNVCDECLEEDYEYCEDCETYHRDYRINWLEEYNRHVCNDCLDDYSVCQDCGCYVEEDDEHTDNNGSVYCNSCWEALEHENENENEEEEEVE